MLREPVKKRFGGTLANRTPFERLAMLQRNADALVGNWRGKNDGTHIRFFLVHLLRNDIRFIVVGGLAVTLNGYIRLTEDIDILIDLSPANLTGFS